MIIFTCESGGESHYHVGCSGGSIGIAYIRSIIVICESAGSRRVGCRHRQAAELSQGRRDTQFVCESILEPVIITGISTPVFLLTISIRTSLTKQVVAVGICLCLCYLGIRRTIVIGICPKFKRNTGNTTLIRILNTVVIRVLPYKITNFNRCRLRVTINITESNTFTESKCFVARILINLIRQSRRPVQDIKAKQSTCIQLIFNWIYVSGDNFISSGAVECTSHGSFGVNSACIKITPVKLSPSRPLRSCGATRSTLGGTRTGARIGACYARIFQFKQARSRVVPGSQYFTPDNTGSQCGRVARHQWLFIPVSRLKSVAVSNNEVKRPVAIKFNICEYWLFMR